MAKTGKFVLSVGDEGGILTYFNDAQIQRRLYAPSPNYADTRSFAEAFAEDPKAPIYLLIDVMDQSYIQQSLPPVSSWSVNQLIKRKMARDYPADDLKGALLIGREQAGRRDWNYLFVTVSASQQLDSWLDLVIELPNQFKGIYPVPVEAENFIHRLRESVTGKTFGRLRGKKKAEADADTSPNYRWQLLVAHNKVSGFRQVVLKNGKLVFARLAQPIGENQPDVIAGSIEQEISVTVEYLKRLGYSDDQGMEVFILASEAIRNAISPSNIRVSSVHIFSPHQAAQRLNLQGVTEPTDQFADSLLSAGFVTAKKHPLALVPKRSIKINQLYASIWAVKIVTALVAAAMVIGIGYHAVNIPLTISSISEEEMKIRSANQQLVDLRELEKNLPDDLEVITDLLEVHRQLNNLGASPLASLRQYSEASKPWNMLLSKFEWSVNSKILSRGAGEGDAPVNTGRRGGFVAAETAAPAESDEVKVSFTTEFFETQRGTDGFNQMLDEYLEALKKAFPNYKIEFTTPRPGVSEEQKKNITLMGDKKDPLLEMRSYSMGVSLIGNDAPPVDPQAQENAPTPRRRGMQ